MKLKESIIILIIKLYYNRKYVYYVLEIMNKKNYTIVEKITLHLFTLVVMSAFISSILISRTIFCSKCISRRMCVCLSSPCHPILLHSARGNITKPRLILNAEVVGVPYSVRKREKRCTTLHETTFSQSAPPKLRALKGDFACKFTMFTRCKNSWWELVVGREYSMLTMCFWYAQSEWMRACNLHIYVDLAGHCISTF